MHQIIFKSQFSQFNKQEYNAASALHKYSLN